MKRWLLFGALLSLPLAIFLPARLGADEGMWLFNAPPTAAVRSKYGFELTKPWLDHTRLSSVRFNNGGSGSFVSADGLAFTNHHVGATCIHGLSTGGKDYMKTGFYARTQAEEAKCPDLELNVLQDIEDVTQRVTAAGKPGMSAAEQGQAQRAAMSAIEQECATATGLRCDVVTFYAGAVYNLYKYKKYTDVRLVFAPEFPAAFFGGDPDNFEYPRYDLDICFFRVYENGKPVRLENYFKWSTAGLNDGELVFVSGNPGSTGRLNTTAQLDFLREVQYPQVLRSLARRDGWLKIFSAASGENAHQAQEYMFGVENSLKAFRGYNSGLTDKTLMARKAADEDKLKAAAAGVKSGGDAWAEIAAAMDVERRIYMPLTYLERRGGFRGDLAGIARILVRAADEKARPNGERLREYRDSALPSLEQGLFSPTPIYKTFEKALLGDSLAEARDEMPGNPAIARVLGGRTPAEVAADVIDHTRLDDIAVRKQLYQGGQAAIAASNDPMIALMKEIDPASRAARKQFDDEVDAVVTRDAPAIARIRFASQGANLYPGRHVYTAAQLRQVRGYTENGQGVAPAGTSLPYFTTFARGLSARRRSRE